MDLSTLHWWAGVGNDLSIADRICGCRKMIGQKLAEKEPTGVPTQLQLPEIICLLAPHENKHPFWLLILKTGTGITKFWGPH